MTNKPTVLDVTTYYINDFFNFGGVVGSGSLPIVL